MKVENHSVVSIHYVLTDDDDQVIDSSEGGGPLTYLHGVGGLVPGLEKEITGRAVGDTFRVAVDPAEGYGLQDPALIQSVPRDAFAGIDEVLPGMQFQSTAQDGSSRVITVTGVAGDHGTIDLNHPLAGKTLHFAIEITAIRDATAVEIEHGHVH